MRVMYFKWNSFGDSDIREAFETLGHKVIIYLWDQDSVYRDEKLQMQMIKKMHNERTDIAFSFDYYPPIAVACHEEGIPYVSWIYDSPYVSLYSFTALFETNHIFVFDKELYEEFHSNNVETVHYMPLAANPVRLRRMIEDNEQQKLFNESIFCNRAEIAFVGAMYNEEHTFFRRLDGISERVRGYLEGVIASQMQIWGYNFVRSLMGKDVLDELIRVYPLTFDKDCVAGREYVYAEYCVNREITARERMEYLAEIGKRFSHKYESIALDLYTINENLRIPGIYNHGFVGPEKIAPFVYNRAKINLNISLRSIHTGIPLRVFEIMGSGGFLLSNYQADFADCYVDGVDYVSFGSKEDMLEKIEYYLSHEKERSEIAENGLKKTFENHTYENRVKEMIGYINTIVA